MLQENAATHFFTAGSPELSQRRPEQQSGSSPQRAPVSRQEAQKPASESHLREQHSEFEEQAVRLPSSMQEEHRFCPPGLPLAQSG